MMMTRYIQYNKIIPGDIFTVHMCQDVKICDRNSSFVNIVHIQMIAIMV